MSWTRRHAMTAGGAALLPSPIAARAIRDRLEPIPLSAVRVVADGLRLPEGIAVDRAGRAFVSNQQAACLVIEPDGGRRFVGPATAANGLTLDGRGGAVIAVFGLLHDAPGPLVRLDLATGAVRTLASEAEGRALVASNFPAISLDGGIYCSHSTWADPGNIGTTLPAGFVYRVAADGQVRVVARDIRGANGLSFDAGERHLYVASTAAGAILRFARSADGFGPGEPYGPVLGRVVADETAAALYARVAAGETAAGYPDGIAFDVLGNLWVTLPFANRVVAITPRVEVLTIIDDPSGRLIENPTNLAFGGPGLRDLWIVSRRSGRVMTMRSPVAGLPLPHHG